MGLSKVTVLVGENGLGRRPLNHDKISGILFFSATVPAGFSLSDNVKKVYSLQEAETLGIAEGSADHDVEWYHISEYFRIQPEGELWVGYYPVPAGAYAFTEIADMVNKAGGEIRQLGVYANALTFAAAQVTTIQAVLDGLGDAYKQFSVLYAANMSAIAPVSGWSTVTDLRTLAARKVSVVIAESGTGDGLALAGAKAYSITALGAALGAVSKASVEQSIGNPANFPINDGIELEVAALSNGDLISAMSPAALGGLKDKGYLIARHYMPDISGVYFERCPCAVPATNDFAFLENNRVVDKAIRAVRSALVPQLNANVPVKADGKLREDMVGYFTDLAQTPLDQMKADSEISDGKAFIDPAQDVLSTSTLEISVKIVPVGIAEEIIVKINLTTKLV